MQSHSGTDREEEKPLVNLLYQRILLLYPLNACLDCVYSLVFNTDWNPDLPKKPGEHSMVLSECILTIPCGIHCFTGTGPNCWIVTGKYLVKQSGGLTADHMRGLPVKTRLEWVKGIA